MWNPSGQIDFFFPSTEPEITVHSPVHYEYNSSLFRFYADGTNLTLLSWHKKVSV